MKYSYKLLERCCLKTSRQGQPCDVSGQALTYNASIPYRHRFKTWQLHFWFNTLLIHLVKQQRMTRKLNHLHKTTRRSSWLLAWPDLALDTVTIRWMNRWVKICFCFASLLLSNKIIFLKGCQSCQNQKLINDKNKTLGNFTGTHLIKYN